MIQNQAYVFLISILVGGVLAIIFDFFRLLRRKGNTKNYVVYIQDVLYWLIVTFIIIISAFITNDGELRGYMFIGYILGAVIYVVTISPYILKFTNKLLDFIESIFKNIYDFFRKLFVKNKKC
jgi:spore cortex biosynthesis protein YabQ